MASVDRIILASLVAVASFGAVADEAAVRRMIQEKLRGPLGIAAGGMGSSINGAEFAREPDAFLGYLAMGLTMGQWLCLPMIAGGLWLFRWSRR